MIKKFLILIGLLFALSPLTASARDTSQITDWYIKDFQSEIVVNQDSTATITELITADCGNLPDKHGIFRVLPTRYKNNGKFINTPVELASITDFSGTPYHYQTSKTSDTLTWKIGDANKTVTGVNYYKIVYTIKNIIIPQANTDQFYLNLTGNSWVIDIDSFHATVRFPGDFDPQTLTIYSGVQGTLSNLYAQPQNINNQTVEVFALKTLTPGNGISLKTDFPKGVFTPYKPSAADTFRMYSWILLPLFLIALALFLFFKYGRDPKINKSIVPEFAPPENLDPMALGRIFNRNKDDPKLIAALLISLAVRGYLKIEEIKTAWYMGGKDYKFRLLKTDFSALKSYEKTVLLAFFEKHNIMGLLGVQIPDLSGGSKIDETMAKLTVNQEIIFSHEKRFLAQRIIEANKLAKKWVIDNGYYEKIGITLSGVFYVIAMLLIFLTVADILGTFPMGLVLIGVGIFYIILGVYMSKLTLKGAQINYQTKGLKLYMDTAERYRQQFNEKENIFEKFLPYAIMFGITKQWAKKIKEIYGEDYINNYHPVWFVGSVGSFDIDSFSSSMQSVASAVSSSASSGSGGSGGGGGGGGGGGW